MRFKFRWGVDGTEAEWYLLLAYYSPDGIKFLETTKHQKPSREVSLQKRLHMTGRSLMSANRLLTVLIVATGQDGSACIYVSSSRSKHCHNHGATLNKVTNRI